MAARCPDRWFGARQPHRGHPVSVIPQNTFSGNKGYGLVITGRACDNYVFDSFVGPDVLGMAALANHDGGVLVSGQAHGNSIGGTGRRPST